MVEQGQESALTLSGKEASSDTIGEELLRDIKGVFESKESETISSTDLCESLVGLDERAWSTWSRGRPITMRKIATFLGKYGIKSKVIRHGNRVFKGYEKVNFEDAWERYLFPSSVLQVSEGHSVTTRMDKRQATALKRVTAAQCNPSGNGASGNAGAGCNPVTLKNPESQAEGKSDKKGVDVFIHEDARGPFPDEVNPWK